MVKPNYMRTSNSASLKVLRYLVQLWATYDSNTESASETLDILICLSQIWLCFETREGDLPYIGDFCKYFERLLTISGQCVALENDTEEYKTLIKRVNDIDKVTCTILLEKVKTLGRNKNICTKCGTAYQNARYGSNVCSDGDRCISSNINEALAFFL